MGVDHLKIEAWVDKMHETTEGINLDLMTDLEVEADLTIAQMYSILELPVRL